MVGGDKVAPVKLGPFGARFCLPCQQPFLNPSLQLGLPFSPGFLTWLRANSVSLGFSLLLLSPWKTLNPGGLYLPSGPRAPGGSLPHCLPVLASLGSPISRGLQCGCFLLPMLAAPSPHPRHGITRHGQATLGHMDVTRMWWGCRKPIGPATLLLPFSPILWWQGTSQCSR